MTTVPDTGVALGAIGFIDRLPIQGTTARAGKSKLNAAPRHRRGVDGGNAGPSSPGARKARRAPGWTDAGLARYSHVNVLPKFTVAFVAGNAGHFTGTVVFGTTMLSARLLPPKFVT